MGARIVRARGAFGKVGGMGESLFFWRDNKGAGGVEAALPAQFRRGWLSDVPLRFGTGQGERGDKGEQGRRRRRRRRGHA